MYVCVSLPLLFCLLLLFGVPFFHFWSVASKKGFLVEAFCHWQRTTCILEFCIAAKIQLNFDWVRTTTWPLPLDFLTKGNWMHWIASHFRFTSWLMMLLMRLLQIYCAQILSSLCIVILIRPFKIWGHYSKEHTVK